MQNTHQKSQEIMARRGLVFHTIRSEYQIDGSPERCLSRHVAEDDKGRLWLMEHLADGQRHSRNAIATILANIAPDYNGVPVPRALVKSDELQYIENIEEAWQVSPFYVGTPLPRPKYLQDAWRGVAVGIFLKQLHDARRHLDHIPPPHIHIHKQNTSTSATAALHYTDPTNIIYYVAHVAEQVRKHPILAQNPQKLEAFARVLAHLDTQLPPTLAAQPMTLAHGDLHPLNCIWRKDQLVGVIDWEFCGARPILYDMANCLGCCGFEHPSGLVGNFAKGLLKTTLLPSGFLSPDVARLLPTMVMALRFAWLSEWCKKQDHEMLTMELEYLQILLYNHDLLIKEWTHF
ncbi:MAG: aminoglycoside phosphotransferase family protein [Pseudomonadota bacterium]